MYTTLNDTLKQVTPAVLLEQIFPRNVLPWLRLTFQVLLAVSLAGILLYEIGIYPSSLALYFDLASLIGFCLIFSALWGTLLCMSLYQNWHYFNGIDSTIGQKGKSGAGITYDVAKIFSIDTTDTTRSFLTSTIGQDCMSRLEIAPEILNTFLNTNRINITTNDIILTRTQTTTLPHVAEQLYDLDAHLAKVLSETGVSKALFLETVKFVSTVTINRYRQERWWSRDKLSHSVGIGAELAFGNTPFVDRYSQPLLASTIFSQHTGITPYTTHYANRVLEILATHSASNVLIIGEVGVGRMDIVYNAAQQLTYGTGIHALFGHHVVVIDTEKLFSAAEAITPLEETVTHFFEEALQAGNITLVIPSLHTFVAEGEARGLLITDILERYLEHPDLHIIAIDTPEATHSKLQNYRAILRRFESLLIEPASIADTVLLLREVALNFEQATRVKISYLALQLVAEAAARYLNEGVMPDRAIMLLERIFDTTPTTFITRAIVHDYLSTITGINIGPLSEAEREELLTLEDILSAEVMGQDEAVKAVANTLRRARIDTSRHDKPKGSFLFLGPTGVGKTALAKALAKVHHQSAFIRFDMSEFSHADALGYLIGDHNGTGMLTDQLRDHPFSVVLFDEFEKAHPTIHDLFLQILDEGFFTSTHGQQINARNLIIVATSNAGSTLITRTKQLRADSPVLIEEILRHLIDTGVFRPELLNRFDETIIFEPLNTQTSRYIIQKNLTALTNRLKDDGYRLEIEEAVIDILLKRGFSAEFGARPLQRVIQDLVEAAVAKQIIEKNIQPGGLIVVTQSMLE